MNNEQGSPKVEKKAPRKSVGDNTPEKPRTSTGAPPSARKPGGSVEPATLYPGGNTSDSSSVKEFSENERKPLPRVILRLGKRPEEATG